MIPANSQIGKDILIESLSQTLKGRIPRIKRFMIALVSISPVND